MTIFARHKTSRTKKILKEVVKPRGPISGSFGKMGGMMKRAGKLAKRLGKQWQ
jgi:predicted small secreted protein